MKIQQLLWDRADGWRVTTEDGFPNGVKPPAHLVLYFTAPGLMNDEVRFQELRARFPEAPLVGCSTGGEILGDEVYDDTITATALWFEQAEVRLATHALADNEDSHTAGLVLSGALPREGLRALFVLSDGTHVNGSALVAGCRAAVGEGVIITGGLAGDGAAFQTTRVGGNAPPQPGQLVAVGFYGAGLQIGHGSFGGWDRFGPERVITRSAGNVLLELDGEPALDLYKRYLGEEAKGLPGSALLFPLSIRPAGSREGDVVRTVIAVDEQARTMTFAGDVPQGYTAQLMRGNFTHLVEGAVQAAEAAQKGNGRTLAILISCIGRKLLMGQRVLEEVVAVADVLGSEARLTGFYSYGEISPHGFTGDCQLHNQTMTITTIGEA